MKGDNYWWTLTLLLENDMVIGGVTLNRQLTLCVRVETYSVSPSFILSRRHLFNNALCTCRLFSRILWTITMITFRVISTEMKIRSKERSERTWRISDVTFTYVVSEHTIKGERMKKDSKETEIRTASAYTRLVNESSYTKDLALIITGTLMKLVGLWLAKDAKEQRRRRLTFIYTAIAISIGVWLQFRDFYYLWPNFNVSMEMRQFWKMRHDGCEKFSKIFHASLDAIKSILLFAVRLLLLQLCI